MLVRLGFNALVAICLAVTLPSGAAFAQQSSPTEAYERSFAVMKALPQPEFMTYTTSVRAQGVRVALSEGTGKLAGYAGFDLGWGGGFMPNTDWNAAHRLSDDRTVVVRNDKALIVTSPLYDASWSGADDWLKYGISGPNAPFAAAKPAAALSASPDARVIGYVKAIVPSMYVVSDGAAQNCPSGAPGRHLRLVARFDADAHPLTDVVIDEGSGRFCSMRFNIGQSALVSLTGSFELRFGDEAGYWVVTDGEVRLLLRAFGLGFKHATIGFAYRNFAYPTTEPARFTAG